MKSTRIALVLLLVMMLMGCENRIETAQKLWGQKKQKEAITKLNEEIGKNPENATAKSLLEQYQVSIWLAEANSLWKAGDKQQVIELLKNSILKYPENIELKSLYEKMTIPSEADARSVFEND